MYYSCKTKSTLGNLRTSRTTTSHMPHAEDRGTAAVYSDAEHTRTAERGATASSMLLQRVPTIYRRAGVPTPPLRGCVSYNVGASCAQDLGLTPYLCPTLTPPVQGASTAGLSAWWREGAGGRQWTCRVRGIDSVRRCKEGKEAFSANGG